jgi:uncharacterized protein YjbI with pentapeptide repeats
MGKVESFGGSKTVGPSQLIGRWLTNDGRERKLAVVDAIVNGRDLAPLLLGFPGADEVWDHDDLRGIDLNGHLMDRGVLVGTALDFATLEGTVLDGVIFDNASLLYTSFSQAQISKCQFVSVCAIRARFDLSTITRSLFMHANLFCAHFKGARLDGVDLSHANCALSLFDQAVLARCDMFSTDLARADLGTAMLTDVSLDKANTFKAILPGKG